MKKVIGVILGILVLILLTIWAYSALYAKPVEQNSNVNVEQTENSDWLIYRNAELGIEFKYPVEVDVEEDNGKIYITADLSWPERGTSLIIKEVEQALDQYIDEYNKSDVLSDGTALAIIFEQGDYSIGSIQAFLLKGSNAIGINSNIIFVIHNDRNYIIKFMDVATDEESKIIESFKFID
jgi:hypothetical protein